MFPAAKPGGSCSWMAVIMGCDLEQKPITEGWVNKFQSEQTKAEKRQDFATLIIRSLCVSKGYSVFFYPAPFGQKLPEKV